MEYSRVRGDDGYIVVETIGAFIPFVLLVVSILSLVNIVAVQARVHFALTQAANTLSMYSYVLEVTGIADNLTTLDSKAGRVAGELGEIKGGINSVLDGIGSISGIFDAVSGGGEILGGVFGWAEEIAADPNAALQDMANYGLNELRNKVFEELARPLIGRYLANGGMTGDEYLESVGVVNTRSGNKGLEAIEFYRAANLGSGNSALIDANGNVRLVADYEIRYSFGGLPLPFGPTLRITQVVVTKAWLNGSGRGYW